MIHDKESTMCSEDSLNSFRSNPWISIPLLSDNEYNNFNTSLRDISWNLKVCTLGHHWFRSFCSLSGINGIWYQLCPQEKNSQEVFYKIKHIVFKVNTFCSGLSMFAHGPLTKYLKLQVAHAPGMPGTFSPPHASRHVRHARDVMHVGIDNSRWRGKCYTGIPGHAQPAILRFW